MVNISFAIPLHQNWSKLYTWYYIYSNCDKMILAFPITVTVNTTPFIPFYVQHPLPFPVYKKNEPTEQVTVPVRESFVSALENGKNSGSRNNIGIFSDAERYK